MENMMGVNAKESQKLLETCLPKKTIYQTCLLCKEDDETQISAVSVFFRMCQNVFQDFQKNTFLGII